MRTLALALALLAAPAPAETLRLGGDRFVRGEVVKETEEAVFVDVGYTILSVPKKEILAREPDAAESTETAAARVARPETALYSTIDRPEASVKENVERCGAAVVMIQSPGGQGSGFIIAPDGYVVTNDHVIQGETRISVTIFDKAAAGGFSKRKIDDVKIVATNAYFDLALLQLQGVKDLPIAYLGESSQVRVGQPVFAIGNPLGLERTVSEGIVSTLARAYEGLTYLQTTTPINPGNSGGPLFDLKGRVIGVTNMGFRFTEGLNFAIPVDLVKKFLAERDSFAYDKDHPNSGFRYLPPPSRTKRAERQS
jgi:serine protease Do